MATHARTSSKPKPESTTYTGGSWYLIGQAGQNLAAVARCRPNGTDRNGGKVIAQFYGPDQMLNGKLTIEAPAMAALLRQLVDQGGVRADDTLMEKITILVAGLPDPEPGP